MEAIKVCNLLLLLFTLTLAANLAAGAISQGVIPSVQSRFSSPPFYIQGGEVGERIKRRRSSRREMIGSVAPTCTYNECRGCKHRCRAEQVPVEGNDPINSAYHYRCVCHR